mgnify:CR=1 FL=1
MDWLEKGYEIHDPGMPYITTHCFSLDPLFSNPRFIAIVKKMNLPLPNNLLDQDYGFANKQFVYSTAL